MYKSQKNNRKIKKSYKNENNKKNYWTIFSRNELLLSLSFDLDLKMCNDSKILKLTRSGATAKILKSS